MAALVVAYQLTPSRYRRKRASQHAVVQDPEFGSHALVRDGQKSGVSWSIAQAFLATRFGEQRTDTLLFGNKDCRVRLGGIFDML